MANVADYSPKLAFDKSVVIADGGTVSGAVDLMGASLLAFTTPASLTGTAITFQASVDGTTYLPLRNAAGVVSVTVTSSQYYRVDPNDFRGVRFLKLVSGTTESGAKTIGLVAGPLS